MMTYMQEEVSRLYIAVQCLAEIYRYYVIIRQRLFIWVLLPIVVQAEEKVL